MRDRGTIRQVAGIAVAASFVAACGVSGLQFQTDDRLAWVTEDRSTVTLPIVLEWDAPGYEITGPDGNSDPDAGYFAVFLDRSPQGRNAAIESLAEDDDDCIDLPGCPDRQWYADNDVWIVEKATSLTIPDLALPRDTDAREFHDFTVVLLDGTGRRQGESALRLRLEVDRAVAGEQS